MAKKKTADIDKLFAMIERDHGGCDQSTCTLNIALRHSYAFVAIDSWIGSGAASEDFHDEAEKGLPFTLKELQKECEQMCKEVNNIQCNNCSAVLWEPEWCDYHCDNCGNDIPKPAEIA